jgi:ATP-binding cassette subfamily G (WHITE) protein 2
VTQVLNELNLGKCASTYIGDERLKGISGGEKKRLQVAAEMVSDPTCLLLDEPTSGLDAATALLTCRTLSRLARFPEKRAVLAVVHQPRASLLQLFDRVVALSDGRPVYAGSPNDLLAHFESVGAPCPAHENPADHLLDLVAIPDEVAGGDQTEDELEASVDDLRKRKAIAKQVADAFTSSQGARDSQKRFQQAKQQATGTTPRQGIASNWLHQFNVLLQRAWLYKIRDEMVVITQVTMACIMALLLGAIYFQQGLSQASIQSRVGAISFSMLLMSFIAFDIVLLFPKERDLYTRESQAGLYGASAFFHARCLAELPGHLTAGGAYATIAYWMMGFQSSAMKFAHFFFLCEAVVFAGTSLLIFCGCCARDFEMANNYATVFFCLFMMFDGHYINNKSIPAGAKWIEDANFFNWAISAGSRSELLGLGDLHGCSNPESSRYIFQRGGDAVDYYGFRDKPFRKAITAIMLISVALRALAFVAFKFLFTGRPVFDTCTKKKQ